MTTEAMLQPKSAEAITRSAANRLARYGLPLALVLLTFIAYGRSLTYDFVYDDRHQIVGQAYTQSWRFAPRYFTENIWAYLYPGVPGNYYRPVFLLWLLIQNSLFGAHPFWWHLVALATQAMVAVLTFMLVRRLTGDDAAAAIAGVIFALHPIHIEVAAWVSGVTESLMALLLISALLCYLNWREASDADRAATTHRRRPLVWLAASLLLFALALLEKETAIVLPLLILVYEWQLGEGRVTASARRRLRSLVYRLTPYALVVVVYLAARFMALRGLAPSTASVTVATTLWTLPSVLWFYVRQLVFPVGLSVYYDTPFISQPGLMNFGLPLIGLIGIACGLVYWLRASRDPQRRRLIRFGAAWILLPLLPVLYLPALYDNDMAHDRYLYLPSVGFAMLAAMAIRQLPARGARLLQQPASQIVVTLALCLFLGLATALQHPVWENNLTLFAHAAAVAPNNSIACSNLGFELDRCDHPEQAIRQYERALELEPNQGNVAFRLGFLHAKLGNQPEAERLLRRAIEIDPKQAMPYVYLGFSHLERGQLNEAEDLLYRGLNTDGQVQNAHYGLGLIYKKRGDLRTALAEFNAELAIHPGLTGLREQIAGLEAMLQQSPLMNRKP